jgi:hypothetical protein
MELTLYDLIDTYEYDELHDVFKGCYDEHYKRAGFEKVFNQLKDSTEISLNDCKICISRIDDPNPYDEVTDDKNQSLSYTSWSDWLGMNIDLETLKKYNSKEVICHCLWEMTSLGYDEEDIEEASRRVLSALANQNELDDLEEQEASKSILKKLLKHEIESSSSSEEF